MNPNPYIAAFAGISMAALCLQIIDDFWVPMLLGAGVAILIVMLARNPS